MSKRWTYQVIEIKPKLLGGFDTEAMREELNRQGAQGWELINIIVNSTMTAAQAVFKKEN